MAQQQKQHVHIINVVEWFSQDGDELKMWCSEFDTLACRDHINLARQAMRVNVLWKQPQLLRLHQQFDQIFQVKLGFSKKATKFEKIFVVLLTRASCSVRATAYLSKSRRRFFLKIVDKSYYTNFKTCLMKTAVMTEKLKLNLNKETEISLHF